MKQNIEHISKAFNLKTIKTIKSVPLLAGIINWIPSLPNSHWSSDVSIWTFQGILISFVIKAANRLIYRIHPLTIISCWFHSLFIIWILWKNTLPGTYVTTTKIGTLSQVSEEWWLLSWSACVQNWNSHWVRPQSSWLYTYKYIYFS